MTFLQRARSEAMRWAAMILEQSFYAVSASPELLKSLDVTRNRYMGGYEAGYLNALNDEVVKNMAEALRDILEATRASGCWGKDECPYDYALAAYDVAIKESK